MARKRIYRFKQNEAEGRREWRALLGGKGANLAEMANMGVPVPPGFTITTQMCVDYMRAGAISEALESDIKESVAWLETSTGKTFGGGESPLLVSVRSGARSSMPGMMDTILDLGLTETSVAVLAKKTQSERFAFDAYRRFLAMFGNVVLGLKHEQFERPLTRARMALAKEKDIAPSRDPEELARVVPDSVLDVPRLKQVVDEYKTLLTQATAPGERPPMPFDDPFAQLLLAVEAVFKSWNTPRARFYRKMHSIPEDWGTAVNVQAMVFGNLGETSATGVAFTRDPSTGRKIFFGEWLPNAQGEDVVAGIRTPGPLSANSLSNGGAETTQSDAGSLEAAMPKIYGELFEIQERLENHFRDMQDIEFTVEAGQLFILQTRNAKRSATAAVRVAVDMVQEGLLHPDEAILRIEPHRLEELLFPRIDAEAASSPVAKGLAGSPGAISGQIVFDADEAVAWAEEGKNVILVRVETSPEDLHGMKAARGILTVRGGATSHAAIVARGMGRPCVVGCGNLSVSVKEGRVTVHAADGSVTCAWQTGDVITIDGATGNVYSGSVPTKEADLGASLGTLLAWTEQVQHMDVRTNADTPEQAQRALSFGASGIGLCRTEHMFFSDERILRMRQMILAESDAQREAALSYLLPFQQKDFEELFRVMEGLPVNIRLLDPPLHEFLPQDPGPIAEVARELGVEAVAVEARVTQLHELNPMLGHRGVRLAITYPEIPRMQVRAILRAACAVHKEGKSVLPEIMVPLALSGGELSLMRKLVDEVAEEVFADEGVVVDYHFGTMIELPRAALLAHELAEHAEFFSFGTNDLTQTCFGVSRDDAGTFLPIYLEQHILPQDPFSSLDQSGVGELIRIAVEKGRQARPGVHLGVCGEHGGDPGSIEFCDRVGLGYVSCSPYRVPIARLVAAQAAIRRESVEKDPPVVLR